LIGRVFRILAGLVIAILLLAVLVVGGAFVALNTGAGRALVMDKVNHYAPGGVQISGLGGHFPADLKLAKLTIADKDGIWLTGDGLELRWLPAALLARTVHVTSLTAASLAVARMPVSNPNEAEKTNSSASLPNLKIDVDQLAIPDLRIGAALAGQDITLNVSGATHIQNAEQADASLVALAANGQGSYRLAAAIDHQKVDLDLHVAEPPDGLLGHYAGPSVQAPLNLDISLHGPRDDAALDFTAALGAAQLTGKGMLGLDPQAPKADVVLTIPSLAPMGALAGQKLAGSTSLHLVTSQADGLTDILVNGDLALTQGPGPAARMVGPNAHLALDVTLGNGSAEIKSLGLAGAGFAAAINGTVAQGGIKLNTKLALNNVGDLSPSIAGPVAESGTINGTAKDFAVHAVLTGKISDKSLPTGPFTITLDAAHLPSTPQGTLNASGELEGYPLSIDATFARDAAGAATVNIAQAKWQSLSAEAALALAKGATLPTGTAKLAISRLKDFQPFAPVPLAGSIKADFSHQDAQNFALNLTASQLTVSPALGPINAQVAANGPINALVVKLNATIASLMKLPAKLAAAAVVNLEAQSLTLNSFSAAWHGLEAVLQGPASVDTKPDLVVHHLALGLNGGSIRLDGKLSPNLNLNLAISQFQLSLAKLFAPAVDATGTISATAAITGTSSAPAGKMTLNAEHVALHSGPAAALPPANLTASATLAKTAATINAKLDAGPNLTLNAVGLVPLNATGAINLKLAGNLDLRLLDPILAATGTVVHGVITPDVTVTGTPKAPAANGTVVLADGTVQNIASGLNLTNISARIAAADRLITLQSLSADAGPGKITGHGTVDLAEPSIPLNLAINADHAVPVSSDLVTETLNAALTITGSVKGRLALGGRVDILNANINIPKSLPPSVAKLNILNLGEKPPPPAPPPPDIALNLLVHAQDQMFIRGDGLFAELGGRLQISGTAANPDPEGGFTLIRGSFALGGKTLQFTKGVVSFNGAGFMPTLDLEASTTNGNTTATLVIGGTAAKPTITLTSSPPLPSDEVLAQLLFGQGTQNLSAFQAAQLAAALAQLAGLGGGANPLDRVRGALGLDELSIGGSGGAPTINAGRYVAPGVYVGASQSATGQGTQATVEVNLYKGLKLTTSTGTSSSSGGNSSSVGLTYQFNY
jgi:translocation and assembly module TamB